MMTRGQNGLLGKGQARVDISFRRTPMTALLQGSDPVATVLRPKIDFENERLLPAFHEDFGGRDAFLQVDFSYGISGRAAVIASIPVVAARSFDMGHAAALRETYTTAGNGDGLLGFRYAFLQGSTHSLVGGLSVEVPVGSHTLRAPAGRADRGILDPMLQPGSGSTDLGATLQYARRLGGSWTATTALSYQLYTTNDLSYRAGSDIIASVAVNRPLFGGVGASLQIKGVDKGRSEYQGVEVPSTGGRILYLVPGITVKAPLQVALYGYLVVPAYRFVNETQLAPRPGVVAGISRTF